MAALVFGCTAAVALAACGVPSSGVIEAGEPASGMLSPSSQPSTSATVSLYFLRDGELTPYPHRIDDAGDLEAVVRLLFETSAANEAPAATTELPRLTDAPRVAIADDGVLSLQLPGAALLSRQAALQLACTVSQAAPSAAPVVPGTVTEADGATARVPSVLSSFEVLGDGWTMTLSDDTCPVAPQSQEQPAH